MALFKLYDCDFSLSIRGVTYTFVHVDSLQIEDPETNELTRGGNAGNTVGISYRQGIKEPKTITLTVLDIPFELHNLLKEVYNSKERVECNCISRIDGSSKIARNALLSQSPKQLSMDDTAESMNVSLIFKSFDVSEVHKS